MDFAFVSFLLLWELLWFAPVLPEYHPTRLKIGEPLWRLGLHLLLSLFPRLRRCPRKLLSSVRLLVKGSQLRHHRTRQMALGDFWPPHPS